MPDRILPALAFVALLTSGCLDLTATEVSGSADASVGGFAVDCQKCIFRSGADQPGCGEPMTACSADSVCSAAFLCTIGKGCFTTGTSAGLVNCGVPCAFEAGITTLNDPGLKTASALFQCIGNTCASACFGQ
jgi:hypothetical protein